MKTGYIVTSRSNKNQYLLNLKEWVEDINDAYYFDSPQDAIHTAEAKARFSSYDLEVEYRDRSGDTHTVYRTDTKETRSEFIQ